MKQPLCILIVEDEAVIAVDIEEALLKAGFIISGIARTYEEAIHLVERTIVHVAVIDIGLGTEPDGVATARALLRHQWMPLIYLTGTTDDATFERAKATNPYAFLNKPLRSQELVQQVQLALHNFKQGEPIVNSATNEALYLPNEQGYARVLQSDIYYLEGAGNFTNVYLTDETSKRVVPAGKPGQPLMLTGNLGYWGNHLSSRLFYRLSKSVIVNLSHIDQIETHQIRLGNNIIALPDGSRKALLDRLHVIRTR